MKYHCCQWTWSPRLSNNYILHKLRAKTPCSFFLLVIVANYGQFARIWRSLWGIRYLHQEIKAAFDVLQGYTERGSSVGPCKPPWPSHSPGLQNSAAGCHCQTRVWFDFRSTKNLNTPYVPDERCDSLQENQMWSFCFFWSFSCRPYDRLEQIISSQICSSRHESVPKRTSPRIMLDPGGCCCKGSLCPIARVW